MRRGGAALVLGLGTAALLGAAVAEAWPRSAGLAPAVARELPRSGVEHPVTAVLLNFRGFDTFLELAVLLAAALGTLAGRDRPLDRRLAPRHPDLLVEGLLAVLVPAILLGSGYFLWLGKSASGGAFQAGVALGAAGILVALGGRRVLAALPRLALRGGLIVGVLAFLAPALLPLASGKLALQLPPESAGAWILGVEAAATLGIAMAMVVMLAALPRGRRQRTPTP